MISVVVPVFNGERFIARALESIRAQTRPPSEVIVIDDGSTDASGRIVREAFPEVRYERQSNGGAAAARNLGVERASREWIAFLDADDFWYPQKLAVQCHEITAQPEVGLVYSDLDFLDDEGIVLERSALGNGKRGLWRQGDLAALVFGGLPFPFPSTVLVRRDTLLRAGGFNRAFRGNYHEDFDAFARVFRLAPVRYVRQSLVGYRMPPPPAVSPSREANWILLLNGLWQLWSAEPELQSRLVEQFARHYAHEGKRLLRARNYAAARVSLRRALAYRPSLLKAWRRLALSYLSGARELYARRKSGGAG